MRISELIIAPSSIIYYIHWATKRDVLVQYIAVSLTCLHYIVIYRTEYKQINYKRFKKIKEWKIDELLKYIKEMEFKDMKNNESKRRLKL